MRTASPTDARNWRWSSDFAVGELASVLMSSCRSGDVARAAVSDIRKAMTPILADILEVE